MCILYEVNICARARTTATTIKTTMARLNLSMSDRLGEKPHVKAGFEQATANTRASGNPATTKVLEETQTSLFCSRPQDESEKSFEGEVSVGRTQKYSDQRAMTKRLFDVQREAISALSGVGDRTTLAWGKVGEDPTIIDPRRTDGQRTRKRTSSSTRPADSGSGAQQRIHLSYWRISLDQTRIP